MNRGMTDAYLHRYFRKEENQWKIDSCVRDMITFTRYNLKDPPPRGFGPFDVVFLRNVIIYFSDEFKQRIFEKTSRLMRPEAYLLLGTGETVSGYTDAFEMIDDRGGICYRLRPLKTDRAPFTRSP
jgi:chemotaxis protein methyltransferase CheR